MMAEMRFKGVVRNGVILPMEEIALPEGVVMDIVIAEGKAWSLLSHQVFAEDWEREEDIIYDNWCARR